MLPMRVDGTVQEDFFFGLLGKRVEYSNSKSICDTMKKEHRRFSLV